MSFPTERDEQPTVSVLIPIGDPRANAEYVKSWTDEQTCRPGQFEVVVVTDGSNPQLDSQLRSVLRPHDRMIHAAGNRFELYDPGARAARAPWLLMTEDHCVAEPGCLQAVIEFTRRQECDGAFLASGHINRTRLARMEQRLYEEAFERNWSRPEYWDKVRARGFLLNRTTYLEVGGMSGRFGHFAEAAMSAKLHAGGFRISYIPEAVVSHVNMATFPAIRNEIWPFGWNECRYRDEIDAAFCEKYFGLPQEWAERHLHARATARRTMSVVWRTMLGQLRKRRISGAGPLCRELLDRIPSLFFGHGPRTVAARINCLAARLRYGIWTFSERRQLAAVRDYWEGTCRLARLQYIARHCDGRQRITPACGSEFTAAELTACSPSGFSLLESSEGIQFRWTSPVATAHFGIPADDYEAIIDTASLRGADCDFVFALFWNGTKIPEKSIRASQGRVAFTIHREMFQDQPHQELTIVSSPLRPHGQETRRLGMPVRAIRFQALSAADEDKRRCA